MLECFCRKVKENKNNKNGQLFDPPPRNVLNSSGGSFRLVFPSEDAAKRAERVLQREFEATIGGSITITCLPYDENRQDSQGYPRMIRDGNQKLRQAKLEGEEPEAVWHSPYHAICASSGEELAVAFRKPIDLPGERERYMGKITLRKGEIDAKVAISRKFRHRLAELTGLKPIQVHETATEAETYAWDARQYVAYLVADGNSMGKYFNNCTPDMLRQLSPQIGDITLDAFASAIMHLIYQGAELPSARGFERDTLPVLPLISGGDDLFVLMPAPWSIHVAMEFSKAYQEGMSAQLRSMGLLSEQENATTGVAVVICKVSYPYRTAYQYAHELLGQAKQRAKEVNQSCLIVDFVVGSDTVAPSHRIEPQPYIFEEAEYFVDYRFELRGLPSRILHQIETALIHNQSTKPILTRIEELYPGFGFVENLENAIKRHDELRELRKQELEASRIPINKWNLPNPLHELLKLWDFCYDMNKRWDEYLTEER